MNTLDNKDKFFIDSYIYTPLYKEIAINNLISFHYYEYGKDFEGIEESHDFWELVYANSGTIVCKEGDTEYNLKQGEAILHPPYKSHKLMAISKNSSSLIISFTCDGLHNYPIKDKLIKLTQKNVRYMATLFEECTQAFMPPYNINFQEQLVLNPKALTIDLQLISNIVEIILINIIRDQNTGKKVKDIIRDRFLEKQSDNDIVNQVIKLLNDNIGSNITISDITKKLNYSPSYLHALFSENTGTSIKKYYVKLKIKIAKELINENNLSITEISDRLGFNSIHYFSKTFKQFVKMSPTEYKESVKKTNIL